MGAGDKHDTHYCRRVLIGDKINDGEHICQKFVQLKNYWKKRLSAGSFCA